MMWEETLSTVGFPIAISIYLLVTQERAIKNNTKALNHINETIMKCKR